MTLTLHRPSSSPILRDGFCQGCTCNQLRSTRQVSIRFFDLLKQRVLTATICFLRCSSTILIRKDTWSCFRKPFKIYPLICSTLQVVMPDYETHPLHTIMY